MDVSVAASTWRLNCRFVRKFVAISRSSEYDLFNLDMTGVRQHQNFEVINLRQSVVSSQLRNVHNRVA